MARKVTDVYLEAEVDGFKLNVPNGDEAEDFVAVQATYVNLTDRMASWAYGRKRALEFFTYLCERDSSRKIVVTAWDSRYPTPIMTLERKHNMSAKESSSSTNWAEIIEYTQDKLKKTKLRAKQLEALLTVFRAHSEAGDPCPADLVGSVKHQ